MNNYQLEQPIYHNSITTARSLDPDHPSNLNLYYTDETLWNLLQEVKIRFDTSPKYYQKDDFQKLIELISKINTYKQNFDYAETSDVEMLVPLLPNMVSDIVNGTFTSENSEMFTGSSQYVAMTSEEVTNLINNIWHKQQ